MKKRKKKNAITLLALVITIVIMLLLAGVAIQMTMGENGLIAKSVQAQKEQAKAELYDTAKLSYMTLNAKALENGQPSPQAELALSTTEFTNKYNVVGDDITDKNGNVIDTKINVLNIIQVTVAGGFSSGTSTGTTTPAEIWPKIVAGVTIPEEEKNDMIIKLKVIGAKVKIDFFRNDGKIIDYGTGNHTETAYGVEFYNGEHIIKISKFKSLGFIDNREGDYDFEIVQWGKIAKENPEGYINIPNVSKVYEPEPDKVKIIYENAKFTEIPEWLFSKKVTSKRMSKFYYCTGLTSIPEGLFNNVNATNFNDIFIGCTGLTSIPEGLFKNNVNAKSFSNTFEGCTGLTSIPEGLFKNNVNARGFESTFIDCTGLTSIPEGLFKNNVNATNFWTTFSGCTGLTSIPEGLFKNNVNAENFSYTFNGCTGITGIPEKIIELGKKAKEKGGNVSRMFRDCTSASNYNSLPDYMK